MADPDDDGDDPRIVGVGPHPRPWPDDAQLDPELLEHGDRRNVIDRFRYWRTEAIVAELDRGRHEFHVAVENWTRDANIGAIVRSANAFAAAMVHVVGRRRWNRRGAMMTERYQHVHHHDELLALVRFAEQGGLEIVGVDNLPGAVPLAQSRLPRRCILLFGQEGPGLSEAARASCVEVLSIPQFGSTRSINASAAAAIA
ncbi:MAG: rRNA methyltransferase, partial [Deltaproteobacteria bacterium]|nr:rRNA methyltransferase [Nannocystaceae bacterium]